MPKPEQVEIVVVGAGPGGCAAAFRSADLGKKVILIDRDPELGGVCLNRGCIPSKALLHISKGIGETSQLAAVFIGVMVISFAATSLDTAVRIQRYIVGEIGEALHSTPLAKNRYLQSGIAVTCSMVLILSDGSGTGGLRLWPLFGSTNQLLGSLALLVISIWLYHNKRNYWYTLVPMVFITAVTFIATYYNFISYLEGEQWVLVIIATVIGICQLWIIFEGIKAFGHKQVRLT